MIFVDAMKQFVKSSLKKVGLEVDTKVLMPTFERLGVGNPSDVKFLKETDLSGALKVIQTRKLLAYWNEWYVLLCLCAVTETMPLLISQQLVKTKHINLAK